MPAISRRKFLKAALTLAAALPVTKTLPIAFAEQKKPQPLLTVDENGDAILHGIDLSVDADLNAFLAEQKGCNP